MVGASVLSACATAPAKPTSPEKAQPIQVPTANSMPVALTAPLPQGGCEGHYTEEARRAAVEGTVILDVIIGETGLVRDV